MSWAEKWIGVPYSQAHCLEFVVMVLREEFGISKSMPQLHQHAALCESVFSERDSYAERVEDGAQLKDGLVVLMRPGADVMHVGLLVLDLPEPYVLHNTAAHGSSVLQPLRMVRRWMKIEGYYDAGR